MRRETNFRLPEKANDTSLNYNYTLVNDTQMIPEGESQYQNVELLEQPSDEEVMTIVDETRMMRNKYSLTSKKKPQNKYKDDIMHILKYAEENNPLSLVLEICQNLKWEHPSVESFQMVENEVNVYKTQIKLKSFRGEGIGITKKISRSKFIIKFNSIEKASVELITHMVLDKTVRDSMRIYINTKSIARDCKLKEDNEDEIKLDEEEFEKPMYKEEDNDQSRVKQIITNYNRNILDNPLAQLDSFRNKYNVPFCFTYTIKEKMHKAVLYVGGEICKIFKLILNTVGFGVDANIRVAKYKAAEEGIKKIRAKYGEEALKYKAVERRKNKLILIEEEQKKKETSMNPLPCRVSVILRGEEIMKSINDLYLNSEENTFRNIEIFLIKYERSLIPYLEYLEIHKILALIFHSNKTLSIHFSNPILAGSFQYDCASTFNLVIDVILFHEINFEGFKEALDMLISKFKLLIKEVNFSVVANITNRINETNLDIMVKLDDKPFSFRFLIRDAEYKQLIYYLKIHNGKVNSGVIFPVIFNSLRRLFRIFRRQNRLIFIKTEVLDWIIKLFHKDTITESVIAILKKLSKNLKEVFKGKEKEVPELIRNEVEHMDSMEVEQVETVFKELLADFKNEDLKKIMKVQ